MQPFAMATTSSYAPKLMRKMAKLWPQCWREKPQLKHCVKHRMGLGSCQPMTTTPPLTGHMPRSLVRSQRFCEASRQFSSTSPERNGLVRNEQPLDEWYAKREVAMNVKSCRSAV